MTAANFIAQADYPQCLSLLRVGGDTGTLYGVPDALNSVCFMVIYKILLSGNRAGLLIPGFLPCLPAQL